MPSREADLRLYGLVLVTAAALAAMAASLHMRALAEAYGVICGSGAGGLAHCPACYLAMALLAAGLTCLAFGQAVAVPAVHSKGRPT
ncbi:MAG: hypothetical protein ABI655_10775 [Phenylobacterium sp.]